MKELLDYGHGEAWAGGQGSALNNALLKKLLRP
jgi:hypothetical protein